MANVIARVATYVFDGSAFQSLPAVLLPAETSFREIFSPVSLISSPTESRRYSGLLYTPSLGTNCVEQDTSVPSNLTIGDVPPSSVLIAIAPSSNCRDTYVNQAIRDGARAVILYPSNAFSQVVNPTENSLLMASIPVYRASWTDGQLLANQMNQYSTDIHDVPYGETLSGSYGSDAYVRLIMTVVRSSSRSVPGLWIFLLIVLGILCFIVAVTSVAMHVHQYFARRDLRRRIASGEVDLESLGIKRLTVPKARIDSFPTKIFMDSSLNPTGSSTKLAQDSTFNQSNCAICLDDYESGTTLVRDLPCHHIYHPACIDTFLHKRSSLCPLCKQSVLPKGFIPPDAVLTAATVMRERRRNARDRQISRSSGTLQSGHTSDVEMQRPSAMGADSRNPVNLMNLAPDNEEEAEHSRGRSPLRRAWHTLFPSSNT